MKKLITLVTGCFLLLVAHTATAQVRPFTINGKITSFDESLPLEGVTVAVKGTNIVTGTQADGTFTLSVTAGEKLLVSLEGYDKQEIVVTRATGYDIVLKRTGSIAKKNNIICRIRAANIK